MGLLNYSGKKPTEMDLVTENIARTEGEIQQNLFQLGKMYYEEHLSDETIGSKYKNMIEQIMKLDQNRQGFYKHKLRLQGQMVCVNCGTVIPYGSVFCRACGKKADEKQEGDNEADHAVLKCKNCGMTLESGATFCTGCGTRVE